MSICLVCAKPTTATVCPVCKEAGWSKHDIFGSICAIRVHGDRMEIRQRSRGYKGIGKAKQCKRCGNITSFSPCLRCSVRDAAYKMEAAGQLPPLEPVSKPKNVNEFLASLGINNQ